MSLERPGFHPCFDPSVPFEQETAFTTALPFVREFLMTLSAQQARFKAQLHPSPGEAPSTEISRPLFAPQVFGSSRQQFPPLCRRSRSFPFFRLLRPRSCLPAPLLLTSFVQRTFSPFPLKPPSPALPSAFLSGSKSTRRISSSSC